MLVTKNPFLVSFNGLVFYCGTGNAKKRYNIDFPSRI